MKEIGEIEVGVLPPGIRFEDSTVKALEEKTAQCLEEVEDYAAAIIARKEREWDSAAERIKAELRSESEAREAKAVEARDEDRKSRRAFNLLHQALDILSTILIVAAFYLGYFAITNPTLVLLIGLAACCVVAGYVRGVGVGFLVRVKMEQESRGGAA